MGIHETKALTIAVAHASLCQAVFQTGGHQAGPVLVFVEGKAAEQRQILLDGLHTESLIGEPDVAQLMQPRQQGIGTLVDTRTIYPQHRSMLLFIVLANLMVGFRLTTIGTSHYGQLLADFGST